jgi:hypothetical protein
MEQQMYFAPLDFGKFSPAFAVFCKAAAAGEMKYAPRNETVFVPVKARAFDK